MNPLCYLDANATTFMPEIVIKSMLKWVNKGNPSSHYTSAKECKDLLNAFSTLLLKENDLSNHTVIFTSGASESNSHILTSSVRSFMTKTGHLPHIIISSVEHKSVLKCCEDLKNDGLCQYTKLPVITDPNGYGTIDLELLEAAIKPNTCIISIMTANNETGIINDIPALAAVSHKHKIPFHTDCVQSFGKFKVYNGIDACSISFHKLHGPPGIGCLIIRNNFIEGYDLKALIAGSQNFELRGGTENIPGIGASYAAYKYTYLRRDEKNQYLTLLKEFTKNMLNKYIPCFYIEDYEVQKSEKNKIFWIAPKNGNTLPNTILLAVYKDRFCNIKMKEALSDLNIIISIGSACNTASISASDVVHSLNIPNELRSGILRISMCDSTTKEDIINFIDNFIKLIDNVQY